MESTYIVSFGNSTKYRLTLDSGSCMQLADLKANIRRYLEDKFPQIKDLKYYDKMTVVPVEPQDEEKYKDYEEFDPHAVEQIKQVLSTEVEDARSLDELNSNAAFGGYSVDLGN